MVQSLLHSVHVVHAANDGGWFHLLTQLALLIMKVRFKLRKVWGVYVGFWIGGTRRDLEIYVALFKWSFSLLVNW